MDKFKVGDRVKAIAKCDGVNLVGKVGTVVHIVESGLCNFGVEFDEKFSQGHNCNGHGKFGHCRYCEESSLELVEPKSKECIVIYRKDNEVIALDKTTGNKGVAKCSSDDEFNFKTGAKIAFERLIGNGVREVKRAAKVGEYIKIVNSDRAFENEYKNGDILKVVKHGAFFGDYLEIGRAYYKDELRKYASLDEYVVLEGYVPSETLKEPEKFYNGKVVCVEAYPFGFFTKGKMYEIKDGKIESDNRVVAPHCARFKTFEDVEEYFRGLDERKKVGAHWSHSTLRFIELVED